MPAIEQELALRIATLEKELHTAWDEMKEFEAKVLARQRSLKAGLLSYLRDSRFLAYVTAPVIYAGIIPFALLDLFLWVYQAACFPVYGIPKVKRSHYILFDRGRLKYLNSLERMNCVYCSYANGLFAYAVEVGANRTTLVPGQTCSPLASSAFEILALHSLRRRRALPQGNRDHSQRLC